VPQHHHGAEEQSGGVGETLASDVGSGTVDGLEDGALVTNVARGSETETANQTSAHVGQNVTVQVGHDQDLVVVREGVSRHLQAGVVQQLGVELNIGELLGNIVGNLEEETVGHLHDGGLVNDTDLLATDGLGVLEGEPQNTLAGITGDELDALDDAINHDVLDTRVLALGILTDQDGVDIIVGGLVAGNRAAGSQVGKEVEGSSESKVEGDVALADGGGEGSLQGDFVPLDALDSGVGDRGLAILEDRIDVDGLPGDGGLLSASVAVATGDATLPSGQRKIEKRTLAAAKMSLTATAISGPMPSPSIKLTG
jgi:hypothetical protein